MRSVLYEILEMMFCLTVSVAGKMYPVNAKGVSPFSHGMVVCTPAHVARKSLRLKMKFMQAHCSGIRVFLLGMIQKASVNKLLRII